MELNCKTAEKELEWAGRLNPGRWIEHSRFVALACKNIAAQCEDLSSDRAYCYGLLHDIGRYAGVTSEKHLIDGYRFCMERGWEKAAQICITHAFMIQDIKTSIGTFDVALRYGTPPFTVDRWRKTLEIKEMFERKIGGPIYKLLPGVIENSFR